MRAVDRLRSDRGFTLMELLVAMSVCVVGIMATVGVIDASRHVVSTSEKRETMAHQAERSLDELIARPFASIGHVAGQLPGSSSDPKHPGYFVRDGGLAYQYDWRDIAGKEPFATSATGLTSAQASTRWTDGQSRLAGWTFRYVTNYIGHAKRVTVAVTVDGTEDKPAPIVISSIVTEPDLS